MNKKGVGIITLLILGLVVGGVVIFIAERYTQSDGDETPAETVTLPPETSFEEVPEPLEEETPPSVINETNVTEPVVLPTGIVNLRAHNLTLTNEGCEENNTSAGCSIYIEGVIRNAGTEPISTDFTVHFYDAGSPNLQLLESFLVTETLASGATKKFTYTYDELSSDTYFVQMKVDATSLVAEPDENDNIVNKGVQVLGPPSS